MEINFDLVIDTEDYSVDMKSGLDTLSGASEVTRHITEAVLNERVAKALTKESKIRTRLKKSFKGSYGQMFSLQIESYELQRRFKKIGKEPFIELMSYFINEALYKDSNELSTKAKNILINLGESTEQELIDQLRKSSLEHLHTVSSHFNESVKFRYRKNRQLQPVIADIDRESHATLVPRTDKTQVDIIASITRLNINTGNGRLLVQGENSTVAFGFPNKYKDVRQAAKKKFSNNLDTNNGINKDEWKTLKLKAHTLKTTSGTIIKYLIEGIYDG